VIVYLASAMDAAEYGMMETMRREARDLLPRQNLAYYDPSRPCGGVSNDPQATVDINNHALGRCDGVLAIWPDQVVSVGVPMEISEASSRGKPVVCVGQRQSQQLRGMGVHLVDTVRQGAELIFRLVAEAQLEKVTFKVMGTPSRSIRWTGDEKWTPKQGYPGDAGYDLFVAQDTVVPLRGFADVDCGISIELPPGTWAMITGRSSTIRRRRIHVVNGIIDNGYRGPLFAACQNMDDASITLNAGERIAQLIPFPLVSERLHLERVAALAASDRGTSAFGSTGH
jgi:dUTP pyrophosphatase